VLLALALALLAPAGTVARVRHDERVVPPRAPRPPVVTPPAPKPGPFPVPKPLARMQAVTREFSITLSRKTVPAGQVSIELANFGQDPHDLRVERVDHPDTGFAFTLAKPGSVASKKLSLAPGEWKLYCTLEGHAAAGMRAYLTVQG
jgi:hypothetical protein